MLRAETRPTHLALERRLGLQETPWSRERYAAFLRATLAVVSDLEDPIRAGLGARLAWRARAGLLRSDLAQLGEPAARPPAAGARAMATEDAFGAAYVLRGSEMGAPLIARELADRLALRDDQMSYLRPRSQGGPAWADFVAALDAFGVERQDARARVLAAAHETFAAFDRAFAREGFA